MIAAARIICIWVRSLFGVSRSRALQRPAPTKLTVSQEISGVLVVSGGDWRADPSQAELDLVGVLIGVEGWSRMREFAALEVALPHLGSDPLPLPAHSLDRLAVHESLVRLGWDQSGSAEGGLHGGTAEAGGA